MKEDLYKCAKCLQTLGQKAVLVLILWWHSFHSAVYIKSLHKVAYDYTFTWIFLIEKYTKKKKKRNMCMHNLFKNTLYILMLKLTFRKNEGKKK